jgi:DNA gyrase subunit A
MAIYETMVRLTRGNESLLHPFIDSKGTFGKQYSSNMKFAASRYTEVRLDKFSAELFRGIDKNAVDMVPNYDNTMTEPVLFPVSFPNVLVTPNTGIAVGMASSICPFNLAEICDGTIALLKNPKTGVEKLLDIIKAPDFPGGGTIIYDRDQMRSIYETGQGSVKIRARYNFDKTQNCIDILQIPYSTSIELIMNRIAELVKDGKLKEVVDFRDEIDLNGFKLTIDLRKGTDPDKLMAKLYKLTPLEDSFKCNFNVLVNSAPRQMGVVEILNEWISFRMGCVRRELTFDLGKKQEKLHLLRGLAAVFLDIDKAIRIVRKAESDAAVIRDLMDGFSVDEKQAEFIAEIKLRHFNREYILNRVSEIEGLEADIAQLEELLADDLKIKAWISKQLSEIKKTHGQPRKSYLEYASDVEEYVEESVEEDYNVNIYLTREGYFKKITLLSLRGNDEHKFKEGDSMMQSYETTNAAEVIFFTDKCRLYRVKVSEFENTKASAMGDFLPAKLGMESGEKPIFMRVQKDYPDNEHMIFIFENGKGVRVPLASYETKSVRRKLQGAYSEASPIVAAFYEEKDKPMDIMMINSADRAIIFKSSLIPVKTTRTAGGVSLMTLKKDQKVVSATVDLDDQDDKGYRKYKLPATGTVIAEKDIKAMQLKID